MIRIALIGLFVAVIAWCVFLYRRGGWQWASCFVLTATVVGGVAWYALIPVNNGLSMAKILNVMGGSISAAAVAGVPAVAWFVVSLVHPRGTRGGHIYAVVYSMLIGLCFIPAGLVAAACYFPAVARKVLGRVADALPGRPDGA
jgi:hypothetical protein